ncbi:MAG: glycine cleavage system aminomethyltransferase GcvT [Bradymonadales bacterium]|nr:MAG: glycine cleavage system aminomethyltransferase GcvT [Bradymonadales bacterium]
MPLKQSPLHEEHLRLSARMQDFAGFEMPISYDAQTGGTIKEHLQVRSGVGIFDVSHMGQLFVEGAVATEFLSYACTRDFHQAKDGRATYCLLLNENAGVIDDIIVYRRSKDRYLLIVNAANIQKDFEHLKRLALDFKVEVRNESEAWALIAVQGPQATKALEASLNSLNLKHPPLDDLKYYSFVETENFWIARTGYTGEEGFEWMLKPEAAPHAWGALIREAAMPIGLAARDTLRMEVGFPLYGQELSETENASESLSQFAIRNPSEFFGKSKLRLPPGRQFFGFLAENSKPMRALENLWLGEKRVGQLTSGSYSPCLGKGMGLGWLDLNQIEKPAQEGAVFMLESRGKRREAKAINLPFLETARVKRKPN